MAELHCDDCGKSLVPYGSVHLGTSEGIYRHLCLACYNATIAERCGVDFEHAEFQPITLADADGGPHAFRFSLRSLGERVALDAHEIQGDLDGGYEFSVMSLDPECEPLELFQQLFEKMRRALALKHLQHDDRLGTQIAESGIVRGVVSCDSEGESGARVPLLIIDGKPIRWDKFGEMLMTYEGFCFKLEVYDRSEER